MIQIDIRIPERWPMTQSRIQCCVPFCPRTKASRVVTAEWICTEHWKRVSPEKRRVWLRLVRKYRKGEVFHGVRADRLWARLKRIAIERGMDP